MCVPGSGITWAGAVDRALRFAYATWLPARDGIAPALLRRALAEGGVVAFTGASGAGKSTVSSQFDAGSEFSDDTIAVRP